MGSTNVCFVLTILRCCSFRRVCNYVECRDKILFSSYGGDLATGSSELGELETSTRPWKDAVYLETPQADNVR